MVESPNSSFSLQLPTLQLAVDSTSLGAYKACPRYYQLSIVQGWSPRATSPHLTFGILLHKAREVYEHLKVKGCDHDEALGHTVHMLMKATWERALKRPWISEHPAKNRLSLIRTVVWYLDEFGKNDPIETLILANGLPALELSFRFDSGYISCVTGEPILFCGHIDRIGSLGDEFYIPDIKTTTSSLSPFFFASFEPHNQFSLYNLAGGVAFNVETRGVILDAIQVGAGFSRHQRKLISRSPVQNQDWLGQQRFWLDAMSRSADEGMYPMNEASCGMYGGCRFRSVCSKPMRAQEQWLNLEFTKRIWDPLVPREFGET